MEKPLQKIDDWDSYESPRPRNEKPLPKPINIRGALYRFLSEDLNAKDLSAKLHHVLQSWRQQLDASVKDVPRLLALFLGKKYGALKTLTASTLEPADKLKLASIAPWAKAYGFDLHLIRVQNTKTQMIDSYASYGSGLSRYLLRYASDYYDDEFDDMDEFDANDIEMPDDNGDSEAGKDYVQFTSVIALDGFPMKFPGLIFRREDDYQGDIFLNGKPEDGDRTADLAAHSYDAGELTHTHTRTAILITVSEDTKARVVAGDCVDFVCKALSTSLSKTPTKRENRWKTILLERSAKRDPYSSKPVSAALREAAERWNDVSLFAQTCNGCPSGHFIYTFEAVGLVSAYKKFGWN
ncbi:hypothetical protein B0H19DRAFT_1249783 [Mycena capillaripes]|nr:hypothetical protein B0H19DRAFT_1249783 [Mycena capillaripes]